MRRSQLQLKMNLKLLIVYSLYIIYLYFCYILLYYIILYLSNVLQDYQESACERHFRLRAKGCLSPTG